MSAGSSAKETTRFTGPIAHPVLIRKRSATRLFLLAGWCGLAGGLLEVLARKVGTAIHPAGRLDMLSRHFVWAGPLSNFLFLLVIGVIVALGACIWPRALGWFGPRLLCALTTLPALMVAVPNIYPEAWILLAFGIAVQLVPWLARSMSGAQRWLLLSFPLMVIAVVGLALAVFVSDWAKDLRTKPADAAPRHSECPSGRAGYRARRSPEPLRLPSANNSEH